jgi:hypothetical protein
MLPKSAARLLVVLVMLFPSATFAQRFVQRLCVNTDILLPVLKPIRIPVGCEIIDCCPWCPGPGPLDWRIRIEGQAFQGAEVRLEGMTPEQLKSVKVSGSGKLVGDRIIVQRGTTTISGLPASTAERAVAGSLKPLLDYAGAVRLESAAAARYARGDADAGPQYADVEVQQMRGRFVVNLFRWRALLIFCPPDGILFDRLRVQNISGADNVVVMMDSRTSSGCNNDRVLRTTGFRILGNQLAAGGCNSEIAIFAANNRMEFQSPVNTWTNSSGDVHTSPLQAIVNMPVSVWIANNGAAAQAVNDVANANLLYPQNKIGVQFIPTFNNVSGNANAVATIGTVSCGAIAAIQGSAFYTPNALNIYYVNNAFTGENCARTTPVGDGNISYIGTIANLASLTHEIGHAFGLRPAAQGGHTNGLAGFGDNNIMWGGGPPTRDMFTLGQAFRLNTHADTWGGTMMIADALRPGPGRACPPLTTSAICPALDLDWVRP